MLRRLSAPLLAACAFALVLVACSAGNDSQTFTLVDLDCDGIENGLDTVFDDMDGDLVGDSCDNCPTVANATQSNSDFDDDGGDACDADDDDDDVDDVVDNCPFIPNPNQDPTDADADGKVDTCDNCGTVANATQINSDLDLLGNACDNCPNNANVNFFPTDCNSDGDTADVGESVGEQCDSDHDGIGDACDII